MMKKVLYGVALTLLASASVGSLQSCKDDVNDLKTQTSYDLKNLQLDIEKKLKELEDEIAEKQDKGNYVETTTLQDYATLKYVNKLIFGVEANEVSAEDLAKIQEGGLLKMIEGALSKVSCDCAGFQKKINDLLYPQTAEGEVTLPEDYGESANMIAYLQGKIGANLASIEAINKFLAGYLEDGKGEQEGEYKTLQKRLQEINDAIFALANVDENAGPLGRVTLLENDMKVVKARLDNIESAMTQAFNYLDALNGRLDNLITSIKVERAVSPVFGDLSLPVGIKSNVLFNWYGYSDRGEAVPFPTAMAGFVGEGITLPAGAPSVNIPNGYFDENVELGNVYVTLNPVGHVYNGTELTFTTSAGNKLDFKVKVTPSDYELKHGYTRADEENDGKINGNGFYEGKVTVPNANIESIKLSLDEKLMTSMKNVVKDPTKRNAASLIKALYDQMSGMMHAYALRYDWTSNYYTNPTETGTLKDAEGNAIKNGAGEDVPTWNPESSEKAYAVLSGYDLAVATARPLGFNFLKGEGASSDKVPTIGNLDNFIQEMIDKSLDKINIQGKDMEVVGHKIGFAKGEVSINTVKGELVATVTGVTVDGNPLGTVTTEGYSAPEETSAYINKALSVAIADIISTDKDKNSQEYKETQAKLEASVDIALLQMQKQINEVLDDVNGQIHKAFNNVGDSYIDKANRAIDLYNKVANKINNFLKDPNHYLQAAAFYAAGNNMGILSSNPNSPTVFTGSGNTITLYLSTYTGEIIAPAYMKYVAVTDGPGASNLNSGDLNKVLPGSRIAVDVNVAGFESGKTYELTYQAVDYRGFYSTRKCYIQVKK